MSFDSLRPDCHPQIKGRVSRPFSLPQRRTDQGCNHSARPFTSGEVSRIFSQNNITHLWQVSRMPYHPSPRISVSPREQLEIPKVKLWRNQEWTRGHPKRSTPHQCSATGQRCSHVLCVTCQASSPYVYAICKLVANKTCLLPLLSLFLLPPEL